MKKLLGCGVLALVGIFLFGLAFAHWANKPENVAALQAKRKKDERQRIADEKRKVELAQEVAAKRLSLKLVIDETFAGNKVNVLQDPSGDSQIKLQDNKLRYTTTVTKGQGSAGSRVFSQEAYGDFVAEADLTVAGSPAYGGIAWDVTKDGEPNYYAAYSSPDHLYVRTDGTEHFSLGGFLKAENDQKIRVERFSEHLQVSVNGRVLYESTTKGPITAGKVGLYLGHRGGADSPTSVIIVVKSFKLWEPSVR